MPQAQPVAFPPQLGLKSLGSGVDVASLALLGWRFSRDFAVIRIILYIVHGGRVPPPLRPPKAQSQCL